MVSVFKNTVWIMVFMAQVFFIEAVFADERMIGAWQYQSYDAFTHIKKSGVAFQCRLDKDYIYKADGVWNSELFVRWGILNTTKNGIVVENPIEPNFTWGLEKMLFEPPDAITFIGKHGSFKLNRIPVENIPKRCYDNIRKNDI